MDYRIEQVKTDEQALLEIQQLLQLVFEKNASKFSLDYLKWQYVENPAGQVVGFNAYKNGVLAAHYETVPVYMNINGEKTLGLLSKDTATHPDHRGNRLFTILAEHTYQYAAENGYRFVIGVANAQSTHGFIKNLNFNLIGPLDFKIGLGTNIYPQRDFTYTRYWDQELMEWRLRNPSMEYFKNGDLIVSPIKVGFKKLVGHNAAALVSLPKLHMRPLNLYIGYGADLSKGLYVNLPKFIKRSPFNLIFLDLTEGALPEMTPDNILFELIDFDVA